MFMEHSLINNLNLIKNEVELNNSDAEIIAVSKTFSVSKIKPLINHGHLHFGENKIQEALEKWPEMKKENKNVKLHFVGKLQTNKVKYALPLFDYIHSLDNLKLAEKISAFQKKISFYPKIFIQINIGNENQKSGIDINDLGDFLKICRSTLDLNIIGLMCIPPNDDNTEKYFALMKKLKNDFNFTDLSMGMSADYLLAINYESTFIRVGSKIFGARS